VQYLQTYIRVNIGKKDKVKNKFPYYIIPISILGILSIIYASYSYITKALCFSLTRPDFYEQRQQPTFSKQEETLEVLPSNYEETLQSLNISLEQKSVVELLRYGQTVIDNEGLDYTFILQNSEPLLVNQQMLYEYITIKEDRTYEKIIEEDLLPKLKSILNSSNTLLSILGIFDTRNEVQETWELILDSIALANENKYSEAIARIYSMNEKQEKIFTTLISLTKNKEQFEYISKVNSLIDIKNISEDKEKEIPLEKPTKIYVEDMQEIQNQILDSMTTRSNDLPTNTISRQELYLLGKRIGETNIDDIYTTLYTKYLGNDVKVKILLKTFRENNKDILTISPYIEIEEKENVVNDNNFSETYDKEPISQAKGTVRIPVLMYHQIAEAPKGSSKFKQGLYVSPEMFEKQIAYLTKMNYKTISSKEFSEILATGKNPTQKTVMITFDDGTASQYAQAYPILKKYDQTGVFFIPSSRTSISSDQLKEMALNGMTIDSHSSTHPNLLEVTNQKKLLSEIAGSKSSIQARTGKTVYSIAYPGCVANQQTFKLVASSGYLLGFSCGRKIDHYPSNKYSISRIHVFNDMESFVNLLSGIN